jgi:hypothetical protein
MDTTASRFGIALAVSSLIIGFVGFAVYIDDPRTPIKPVLIHRHASAFEISSAGPATNTRYGEARAVLAQFIAALNEDDDATIRSTFPSLTSRQGRVLRSIRSRLGQDANLSLSGDRITSAGPDQIDIDFVIVAREANERTERRLPFHATVRDRKGSWVIETLY